MQFLGRTNNPIDAYTWIATPPKQPTTGRYMLYSLFKDKQGILIVDTESPSGENWPIPTCDQCANLAAYEITTFIDDRKICLCTTHFQQQMAQVKTKTEGVKA